MARAGKNRGVNTYQIGQASEQLGVSADTLRYYEKISILPPIARTPSGLRSYTDKDLSRLRFVKRAQRMGFSLEEIGQLLQFRENPQSAKARIREMAQGKLVAIEDHLGELQTLRNELKLLVNLCRGSPNNGCPIIAKLDDDG